MLLSRTQQLLIPKALPESSTRSSGTWMNPVCPSGAWEYLRAESGEKLQLLQWAWDQPREQESAEKLQQGLTLGTP